MRIGSEALLMLLAIGLYLLDSSLFLAADEAVLVRGRGGRWFARFGLDRWRLGGKEPCLPNPATPHFPLFRLRWTFAAPVGEPVLAAGRVHVPPELAPFGLHVLLSLLCIFVLLPMLLFFPQGTEYVLGVVALLWLNILAALVLLFRRRAAFGLSPGQFAGLAFECLVCPPFSINLVTRLCARLRVDEDFVAAASRLLDADALTAAKAHCLRRLDEQIDYAADGTAARQALQAGRKRFGDEASP